MRNVGSGIAVLHGWRFYPERRVGDSAPAGLAEFTRLTRDLYVPAGDAGFWQGTFREPGALEFAAARAAIERRAGLTIDLLYGDHDGGQRVVGRFGILPREDGGWLAAAARHWHLDRPDPR